MASLPAPHSASTSASASAPPKPHVNGWTRRDRPCDACRRRKSRCILPENGDTCIMCQSRAEICTFVENPQRRKRRKLEDEAHQSPDAVKPRSPDAERNVHAKPPINDYTSLPQSLLKQTLGLQNRQHSQYLGPTSEYDVRLINLSPFNGRGEYVSTPGTLRRVSHNTHFIMKSEDQGEVDDELANLDLVESIVEPHGRALVDLYFRIIHPSFPIMDKKVFLEKYERPDGYREFTPPILAAVYILALNWWSYNTELVNLPKPDIQKLEKLVPQMMSSVLNRPKLSTVQAGLLLLQRPDGDSWALTGQLVAVAQNLGMHLDCSNWKIPEWERSLRKRLAWALFMQDKWGALVHGRPYLLHLDDWCVGLVEDRDFGETAEDDDDEEGSSDIETGRLTFVSMISLTLILTEILSTFFKLKATANLSSQRENAMTTTLELAKPIQLRLKDWHIKLPRCLAIGETRARKLPPTGSLHLAYFTAEVTLHRAIIRFDSPYISPPLRSITRAAARARFTSAIDLLHTLEPAHLQSFWYFASKVNLAIIGTFGALLWATSAEVEEAEFYKDRLKEYRWCLRVSSKAAEFMKFTVGMLDTSPVFVKVKSEVGGTRTPGGSTGQAGSVGEDNKDEGDAEESGQGELDKAMMDFDSHSVNQKPHQTSTNPTTSPSSHQQQPSPANSLHAQSYNTDANHPYPHQAYHTYPSSEQPQHSFQPPGPPPQAESQHRTDWSSLPQNTNFTQDDIQDWSLDQLYNFENFQVAGEVLASRRIVEEYDEGEGAFAGF